MYYSVLKYAAEDAMRQAALLEIGTHDAVDAAFLATDPRPYHLIEAADFTAAYAPINVVAVADVVAAADDARYLTRYVPGNYGKAFVWAALYNELHPDLEENHSKIANGPDEGKNFPIMMDEDIIYYNDSPYVSGNCLRVTISTNLIPQGTKGVCVKD